MKLNLNGDQMLSLGNYLLAGFGALLMSWGVAGDEFKMAQGLFATAMSFGLAIWMNVANFNDIVLSVGRRAVMIIGVFGVAKGWFSESTAVLLVNGIMAILPVLLSLWHYGDAPGPDLKGTTIVDGVNAVTAAIAAARNKPAPATLDLSPENILRETIARDGPPLPA